MFCKQCILDHLRQTEREIQRDRERQRGDGTVTLGTKKSHLTG